MLERVFTGSRRYRYWVIFVLALIGLGAAAAYHQWAAGLAVTGLSRDVAWGLYIGQFTLWGGVAASAFIVIMPLYLLDFRVFRRIGILAQFMSVAACAMCILFVPADLGRPERALNIILHPAPGSAMFWDFLALGGFLVLNLVIGWTLLSAEKDELPAPRWLSPLIYVSIPWALGLRLVSVFLFTETHGHNLWLSLLTGARLFAGAFAAGPALLILLILVLRATTAFKVSDRALAKLAQICGWMTGINFVFLGLEFAYAMFGNHSGAGAGLLYLYFGEDGLTPLATAMWAAAALQIFAVVVLLLLANRLRGTLLALAAVSVFAAIWIEKLGMVVSGFIPSPLDHVTDYAPSAIEWAVTVGVYGVGLLILTALVKTLASVREEKLLPPLRKPRLPGV